MPYIQEPAAAIEVDHLKKRFPRAAQNAVDDVSFRVESGETFGLLGPNGAGKSTTIGILTTLVRPSAGRATVAGINVVEDPISAKQRIAVVPQRNNLDRTLQVGEILTYHAAYHGVPQAAGRARARAMLDEFGLADRAKQKLGWFSGGMEQRLMLARALMTDPQVLFLDEPTNNLDPQSRLFLWERIGSLHQRGVSIVLTTHDMDEADRLCQRIAIMDQGRILALDTPQGLKRLIPGGTMLELRMALPVAVSAGRMLEESDATSGQERYRSMLAGLAGVTQVELVAGQVGEEARPETRAFRIYADGDPGALVAGAAQAVIAAQARLLDLRFAQPSLEDVFIYLTGRKLRS